MPNRIKINEIQQETKELSDAEQKKIVGGSAELASLNSMDPEAAFANQDDLSQQQKAEESAANPFADARSVIGKI